MEIYETKYWDVELNKDQAYLGRCFISLKRECMNLAGLKKEEILDFLDVVKKLENAIRKTFGATMFNWACLMNDAYKSKNPKPQVHWHCRPRYKNPVEFSEIIFEDKEFAHHYDNHRHFEVSEKILNKIRDKIKDNLE